MKISRRSLSKLALATAGVAAAAGTLPRRTLGKTGLEVGLLGIGTAPFGRNDMDQAEVNRVVDTALDAGINYLDTAPIYGLSERRLGKALKGKRDKLILVSKVEATSAGDANWMVSESLMKLQTDYLDVVHLHNVGRTDRFPSLDVLLAENGALEGLRQLKKKGVIRHIGLTCHMRPKRALPVMDTGDIEVVMCAANFVDRYTYNFEETVFAECGKRGIGVVAMKLLGGRVGEGARLSDAEHYEDAIRYGLSIPGLSVAILGVKSVAELQQALAIATAHKPFTDAEWTRLNKKGKSIAAEWGEVRGPVAWA